MHITATAHFVLFDPDLTLVRLCSWRDPCLDCAERIKAEQEEAKRQRELALERERIAAEARAAEAELLKAEQCALSTLTAVHRLLKLI